MSKSVRFTIKGNGTITANENCVIDFEAQLITFNQDDGNASVEVVSASNNMTTKVSMGEYVLPEDTTFIIFDPHIEYDVINFEFIPKDLEAFCEDLLE